MKDLLQKYALRSVGFGIILTIIGLFNGGIRYSSDPTVSFSPVWLQILRLFIVYATVFLAANVLADIIKHKTKRR